MKSITVKYEHIIQEISCKKKKVYKLRDACKNEILQFRKKLDIIFDNLERNILTELDKWEHDMIHTVDQEASTMSTVLDILRLDSKRIEDAKIDGKKTTMFISDVKVSKALENYKHKLEDLERDIKKPTLEFERNEILVDLISGIETLGSIIIQPKRHKETFKHSDKPKSSFSTKLLIDRTIVSRSEMNVRTDGDKK